MCPAFYVCLERRNLQTGQTQEAAMQGPAAGLKLIRLEGQNVQQPVPPLDGTTNSSAGQPQRPDAAFRPPVMHG